MVTARQIITYSDWYRDKKRPLYHRYPGQHFPQNAYIELNPETYHVDADFDRNIGNAMSAMGWNKRQYRLQLPATLSGDEISDLLEDTKILSLIEAVFQGYATKWDGYAHWGCLTKAAQEALECLENELFRRYKLYDIDDYENETEVYSATKPGGGKGEVKKMPISLENLEERVLENLARAMDLLEELNQHITKIDSSENPLPDKEKGKDSN